MLGRIDPVMTAGQHRQCAAGNAGAMRRRVDAAGEARGDDKTGLAEIARQGACEFQTGAGGIARADHGDDRPHQHVADAAHAEQRWRIVEGGEPRRITVFVRRDQMDAEFCARGQLGMRVVLAKNPTRPIGAAAPRQLGQPLQRQLRAAEMTDQGTEGARPRYYGANATGGGK